MSNSKKMCHLLVDVINKYDLTGISKKLSLKNLCHEIDIVNSLLNQYYLIVIEKNLSKNEAIQQIKQVKYDNNVILNTKEATEVYEKFKKLGKKNLTGGGTITKDKIVSREKQVKKEKKILHKENNTYQKLKQNLKIKKKISRKQKKNTK